jgi:hypothetical protein
MLPEALSTARPIRLRLATFLATALGALMIGAGATLTWATVHLKADETGALDSKIRGLDVWEGKLALVVALGMLVAIPAMRLGRGRNVRRTIAAGILIGSLFVFGVTLSDLAGKDARFSDAGLDSLAGRIARHTGTPVMQVMHALESQQRELTEVRIGPGLPATALGTILGALGGALSIAWAIQTPPVSAQAAADARTTDDEDRADS